MTLYMNNFQLALKMQSTFLCAQFWPTSMRRHRDIWPLELNIKSHSYAKLARLRPKQPYHTSNSPIVQNTVTN